MEEDRRGEKKERRDVIGCDGQKEGKKRGSPSISLIHRKGETEQLFRRKGGGREDAYFQAGLAEKGRESSHTSDERKKKRST